MFAEPAFDDEPHHEVPSAMATKMNPNRRNTDAIVLLRWR
jgi:hypothetical protein